MDLGRAEVVRFLALRPPFDTLAAEELAEMAAAIEVEFHPRGTAILTEDGGPVTFLRVISAGAVSIVHDGRLLDLLSAGDSFGTDAMLAGMAPGFTAVAAEDTLCYRIPQAAAGPLLDRAHRRERELAAGDGAGQAVAALIRGAPVICGPTETVAAVAHQMTTAGADAALIQLAHGQLGIVTDRDLRSRVIAAGLGADTPVQQVMSTPVFTVTPDRIGAEVMFELLERGIHHAPVLARGGRVLGIVSDTDVSAPRQRAWFGLRRAITIAADADALAAAALGIGPILVELHGARVGGLEIARVLSALTDALVQRALELAGPVPGAGLVWLALTSHARRELTPASMPVGAIICAGDLDASWITAAAHLLAAGGLPAAITARTPAAWLAADPDDVRAMMVLTDRRAVNRSVLELPTAVDDDRAALLAALASESGSGRVTPQPTGFDQAELLLSADGARSERVDIHAAAVAPIQALARWSGVAAGELGGSTPERLAAGAGAGVLSDADARALSDAFTVAFELRMAHQMEQIAAGRAPDDEVATDAMSPFMRSQLREVFRTVAAVQRRLAE